MPCFRRTQRKKITLANGRIKGAKRKNGKRVERGARVNRAPPTHSHTHTCTVKFWREFRLENAETVLRLCWAWAGGRGLMQHGSTTFLTLPLHLCERGFFLFISPHNGHAPFERSNKKVAFYFLMKCLCNWNYLLFLFEQKKSHSSVLHDLMLFSIF